MAKRPLSVQLRPSSALYPGSVPDAPGGGSWSARRLSMGDVDVDQRKLTYNMADGGVGGCGVGRRPAELGVTSCCVAVPPRRRDRCSPSSCKRPVVMTLPRLDLSLIQGIIQLSLSSL